jgi:hypothetical protein
MFSFSTFLLLFFFTLYAAGNDKDGTAFLRLAVNVLQKRGRFQDVE